MDYIQEQYQQFSHDFYWSLRRALEPEGYRLEMVDLPGNNTAKEGILIQHDTSTAQVAIYQDSFYRDWQDGNPMEDLVSAVREMVEMAGIKISMMLSAENQPGPNTANLRTAIVHYDANKEWLKDVPHERVEDLALYAKLDSGEGYRIPVTGYLLDRMQMTKEEMLAAAKANTARQAVITPLNEVLMEIAKEMGVPEEWILGMSEQAPEKYLWRLTVKNSVDGASIMADSSVMKRVSQQFPEGFYILPSSIHEVLITPKIEGGMDVEELRELVASINRQEVPVGDRLSDNIYEFDGHRLRLAGQTETMDREMPALDMGIHHKR